MNDVRVEERQRTPATAPTAAPSAARAKGPRVWLDMDQQDLDDAYDQLKYAANAQQLAERRAVDGAAVGAVAGVRWRSSTRTSFIGISFDLRQG